MNYSLKSLSRFLTFLEKLTLDVYAEIPSPLHDSISKQALHHLLNSYAPPSAARVLDVGCGQGLALAPFTEYGCNVTGISLNDSDIDICLAQGFDVKKMDQSFLEFADASFDIIWARHVVEHSVMPYYTLSEFCRVLRPGGLLYLEVPGTNTVGHERNSNHYSVLGQQMWHALLERSGFQLNETTSYQSMCHFFETGENLPDEFWGFYCSSKANQLSDIY